MRYSRMEDRRPPEKNSGSKWAAVLVIIVAIVIAVYIIGASEAGEFLSQKIVDPIVQAFSSDDEEQAEPPAGSSRPPEESPEPSVEKLSFEVDDFSLYALQAGVFADRENAETYAEELKNKGGAGYVTEFEDGFRVFISGYMSEEDAKNVRSRLLAEQNMDTSVYEMKGEGFTAQVTADSATAELTKELDINGDIKRLTEISLASDKGELTEEQASQQISELYDKASAAVERLKEAEEDALAVALTDYYSSVCSALKDAVSESGTVAFSSRVKLAYLAAADARARLSESL